MLLVTGCLRPTPTDSLHVYILPGIAPPEIWRSAASSRERHRQSTDERHLLFGHGPEKESTEVQKKLPKMRQTHRRN